MGRFDGYARHARNLKRKKEAEFFKKHGMSEEEWRELKTKESAKQILQKHEDDLIKLQSIIESLSNESDFPEEDLWKEVILKNCTHKKIYMKISDA